MYLISNYYINIDWMDVISNEYLDISVIVRSYGGYGDDECKGSVHGNNGVDVVTV